MRDEILKMIVAGTLGSGRVLSSAALQNLNIQGTFQLWGLDNNPSETLAIIAAFANSLTNVTTRVKSIYDNFPPRFDSSSLSDFTLRQKLFLYSILSIGLIDSVYLSANVFNAVVQMRCNLFTELNCRDSIVWNSPYEYLLLAGFGAVSSELCFLTFNMSIFKKHVIEFVKYSENFKKNLKKENKKILFGITLIGLLSSLTISGGLYFSTSSMIENLFGLELQENMLLRLQVPMAIGCAIVVNLFTQVADCKILFNNMNKASLDMNVIKQALRKWFVDSKGFYQFRTCLVAPFLMLDKLFQSIAAYAGSADLLKNMPSLSSGGVKIISGINMTNSLLLYFAFNTHRAMNTLAGIKLDQSQEKDDNNDIEKSSQPISINETSSLINHRHSFFSKKPTGQIFDTTTYDDSSNEEAFSNHRCGCVIL